MNLIFSIILFLSLSTKRTETKYQYEEDNGQCSYGTFPPRYLSGSIHYFRHHPADWRDRLQKLKWVGCNAVQSYIEWASHEPEPGIFDFSDGLNIERFLDMAKEENLMVILRPGPYIDAERDMGGLPYWLLRLHPDIRLRTNDPNFMKYVEKWYKVLLPKLRPFMADKGGPVIMVQVENEYGSWPESDLFYTTALTRILRKGLGKNAFLFSTDGNGLNYLERSKLPGVYATIDFGTGVNVTEAFSKQRIFEPVGPLANSEFYPGWLDHWGTPHSKIASTKVAQTLYDMLKMGASVNIYVFSGGTSFGFGAGSNMMDRFLSCPTSYDYDAPITEAGDLTPKYFAIRNVAEKFFSVPNDPPPPTDTPKYNYGPVLMEAFASVFDVLPNLQRIRNKRPKTFEALGVKGGIVAYQTFIKSTMTDPAILNVIAHDTAYIYLDGKYVGVTSRERKVDKVLLFARPNQLLTILVQSQGRICFGSLLNDFKGLIETPTINGKELHDWIMTPLPFNASAVREKSENIIHNLIAEHKPKSMAYFYGLFSVPNEETHPRNTFLRLDQWTKGYAWVNDFFLGLYWPVMGPQLTLYIPHGVLKKGLNKIEVLELEGSPCASEVECILELTDTHIVDGPTPILS